MKKYFKLSIILFTSIICFCSSSEIFAEEDKIGEASVQEEIVEQNLPETEYKIKDEINTNEELIENVVAKAAAEGTHEDPITVSGEKAFKYSTLEDGTICITGLSSSQSKYYKLVIPDTISGKKVSVIDYGAFWYDYRLREVTLGSNVTKVDSYAFYYCVNLSKVNLKNVKIIARQAFGETTIGPAMVLPDTVEQVDYAAFDATQIQSVTLGKNVKIFDSLAFFDSPVVEYKVNSNNANYVAVDGVLYNKEKTELVAYPRAKRTETYTMPSTVKTMRENAAYGNVYLKTVKLSDALEEIPKWAFGQNTSLKTITLGSKIKKIDANAFTTTALGNITIPATVESIDGTAFLNCTEMENIYVNEKNTKYTSIEGVLYTKDKKTLLTYPTGKRIVNYTIPNGTVTIGESAFQGATLKTVKIPTTVTTLEDWCFSLCKNLTTVTIPSSVTKYGDGPFYECENLTSAYVKSSANLAYSMFMNCTKLATVELNDNIKAIDNRVFAKDAALTKITLPSKVELIYSAAFAQTGITSVTIPANVKYLSNSAFDENVKIDVSKTKLTKLDNGDYRIVTNIYINGTFDYKKSYECLELVNKERKAKGLSELKMDKDILEAAMTRAAEISISFEHTRTNATSYHTLGNGKISAENIAAGRSTAEYTMNQLMNSSGHRANILTSSFKSIGIGCFMTSGGTYYWVQNFGAKDTDVISSIPANVKKDVTIQTIDSHLNLIWDDTRKDTSTATLTIGGNITPSIRTINDGWDSVSTNLLNKSFNWKSSNTKVATVDANGKIIGKTVGSVTITATVKNMPNKTISMSVNVKLPFKDVKETDWYYNAVKYVYENNIIKGYDDVTFAPEDKLTRGQLVTILYRMEKQPKVTRKPKFPDVQDSTQYYYNAVKWATDKKIVSGYNNRKVRARR